MISIVRERRPGLRPRVYRALLAASACAALVYPAAASAQVQVHAMPQPATLVTLATQAAGPDDVTLVLTFASSAPEFSVVRDGTDQPAVVFGLATISPAANLPSAAGGIVRSVNFEPQDKGFVLDLHTAGPVHVSATPLGPNTLAIHISRGETQSAAAPSIQTAGTLPRSVDRPPGEDAFEVVPLKYADVSEVVGLLTDGLTVKSNDAFTPQEPAFGSAGIGLGGSGGAPSYAPAPAQPMPDPASDSVAQSVDDTIGVDRRLNAIILRGSPERIARLKEEIAQIDVPVESVLLETLFVELDETGAKNVGLDFNNSNSQIAVGTLQLGAFNVDNPLSTKAQASVALQGAIYAQISAGHGRIVSQPRIAAQSGSTAKIVTGDALPILTSIALSGVNAVSQQVQYVNVGVTLQIAPRVSSDGFVTSHVFCEVSSVTGTSQGYPSISQREAETSATVRDGQSFVIGGLTEESDITSVSKIPGISDLPLVGEALKLNTGTRSKTELYIVVTPKIVHHGDASPIPPEASAAMAPLTP